MKKQNNGFNQNTDKDKVIKNAIEKRVTRSIKKLISAEEVSVNAIDSLIILESDSYKLIAITLKIHQSIQITQSEKIYWNNFTREEKSFIITDDSQLPLYFTKYKAGYYSGVNLIQFVRQLQPVHPELAQVIEIRRRNLIYTQTSHLGHQVQRTLIQL